MAHTLEAIENANRIVSALERADAAAAALVKALTEAAAAIEADKTDTAQTVAFLNGSVRLNRAAILTELMRWDGYASARTANAR